MIDYKFEFTKVGAKVPALIKELMAAEWRIKEIIAGHDGWLLIAYKDL